MKDRVETMVMASFVADSLALGAHWIYDTESIKQLFGRVDSLLKPLPNSYHTTKDKGEFTHYGDQALVLLESVSEKKKFDLNDFSARWRRLFANYQGYFDQATKGTLSQYEAGKSPRDGGSPSNNLAGASRLAPVVYVHRDDPERLVDAVRAQTMMTHRDPATLDSAEFFARTVWSVLNGTEPIKAMDEVAAEKFAGAPISDWLQAGLKSKDRESVSVIVGFGQNCHTPSAFPGVVHLIAKYENDLKEGLIQCVMAGGDSAARGMMVGMVLGAHLGPESLPAEWVSELKKGEYIKALLEKLDA